MKGPVAASLRRSASRPASCLFFGVFVGFIDTKVTYLVFLGKKKSRPKKISSARFWISPIPPVRPSEGAGFESEEFQIRNRREILYINLFSRISSCPSDRQYCIIRC